MQWGTDHLEALGELSSAYSDGMTIAKIQADTIMQKEKTVQQTINTFFQQQDS